MKKILPILGLVGILSCIDRPVEKQDNAPVNISEEKKEDTIDSKVKILSEKYPFEIEVVERHEKTADYLDTLEKNIPEIYPPLMDNLQKIKLYFVIRDRYEELSIFTLAHVFHSTKTMEIAARPRKFILAHELAHLHAHQFPEFDYKWNNIVGIDPASPDFYLRDIITEYSQFPIEGFINGSGRIVKYRKYKSDNPKLIPKGTHIDYRNGERSLYYPSWEEDIAEFVASFYKERSDFTLNIYHNDPRMKNFKHPIELADPSDERYRKKLVLLREYDFISEEQYKYAFTNLGKHFVK